MKKEHKEKMDKGLEAMSDKVKEVDAQIEKGKKKLGEFAPSVMIAVGVTLLIAVYSNPSLLVIGLVVAAVFAMPVIKKKVEEKQKAKKKEAPAKKVKAEVVETKKEEKTEE